MIIPKFKENYKNKTLNEIILERQKIVNKIIEIEHEYLLPSRRNDKNETIEIKMIIEPQPQVVWKVLNSDLVMLTELINEKGGLI